MLASQSRAFKTRITA